MISPKPNSNFHECLPITYLKQLFQKEIGEMKPNLLIGPKKFGIGN